ncbi:MAG: hypothetical protein EZS28_033306, partial [Streblomastix strix]
AGGNGAIHGKVQLPGNKSNNRGFMRYDIEKDLLIWVIMAIGGYAIMGCEE